MTSTSQKTVRRNRGFTLVELIVVIAIIALLSTISLTGLEVAKYKARDSAIVSSVHELQTSFEQEYTANKNYTNLLGTGGAGQWIQKEQDCNDATFNGTHGEVFTSMCKKIIKDTKYPNDLGIVTGSLWIGPGISNVNNSYSEPQSRFTIMVYLPGIKKFYCVGSDGKSSKTEDGGGILWSSTGCWRNY